MKYLCPVCLGDGKETCTNPDHGFISAMGFTDIGRLGCPVCGHDPAHKVKNGGDCEACNGVGKVSEKECDRILDEYEIDVLIDEFQIKEK